MCVFLQIDIDAVLASRRQQTRRTKRAVGDELAEKVAMTFKTSGVAPSGGGLFIPPNTIDFACVTHQMFSLCM